MYFTRQSLIWHHNSDIIRVANQSLTRLYSRLWQGLHIADLAPRQCPDFGKMGRRDVIGTEQIAVGVPSRGVLWHRRRSRTVGRRPASFDHFKIVGENNTVCQTSMRPHRPPSWRREPRAGSRQVFSIHRRGRIGYHQCPRRELGQSQ